MYSWMIAVMLICSLKVSGCVVVPAQAELSLVQCPVLQSFCTRLQLLAASLGSGTFSVSLPSASLLIHQQHLSLELILCPKQNQNNNAHIGFFSIL